MYREADRLSGFLILVSLFTNMQCVCVCVRLADYVGRVMHFICTQEGAYISIIYIL